MSEPDFCMQSPGVFPRPAPRRTVWAALAVMVLGIAVVPFAEQTYWPVYRFLEGRLSFLDEFFSTTRQMTGTTFIVSLILIVWIFDPLRRRAIPTLLAALLVAGAVNESAKQITGRARPEFSINMDEKGLERLGRVRDSKPDAKFEIGRRDQWLIGTPGRPWFESEFASFPSGHAHAAFLLATFLAAMYPRGKWLWFAWAIGCAAARVRFRRHYMEDVLVGGALGTLVACWVFQFRWPVRIADWLTAKWPALFPTEEVNSRR